MPGGSQPEDTMPGEAGTRKRKEKGDDAENLENQENLSPLLSKKEATASPIKKKQKPEASPAHKDPAQTAPGPSSQAGEEPEPASSAAAASSELAATAGVVPAASAAAAVQEREAGGFELPDWQDRPLCLKELQKDEEVHSRFNYIAGLPLVALASEGKSALVEALLKGGGCDTAVLNMRDNNGNTALHLAAAHGRTTIAGLLLEAGAQSGIRNNDSLTALDLAIKGQFSQMIVLLRSAGTP